MKKITASGKITLHGIELEYKCTVIPPDPGDYWTPGCPAELDNIHVFPAGWDEEYEVLDIFVESAQAEIEELIWEHLQSIDQ